MVGLAIDYGSQYTDLGLAEFEPCSLSLPLLSPESVIFRTQAGEKFCKAGIPPDLVGVRNDDAEHRLRSDSELAEEDFVIEGIMHFGRIEHHLGANLGGEFGFEPERTSKPEFYRGLPTVVEHPGNIDGGILRFD